MKSRKVWFFALNVAFLIMCLTFGTAHSQDLSGWVGKWFKLTVSLKGYETFQNENHIPGTDNGKVLAYLKVTDWIRTNPSDPYLKCSAYDQEDETVVQGNVELHYLGGLDLDFLCLGVVVDSEGQEQFTARITGKVSKDVLKSATFKTMGGFYREKSQNVPRNSKAGGFTVTGSLIAESKLPSWVPR